MFRGASESEVQADALGALLRHLDLGPTVIAGGSGGSRVSLLAGSRNPDVTAGIAMWWISGGVPGLLQLANYYCMPSAERRVARRDGRRRRARAVAGGAGTQPGKPRACFLAMDRQEFVDVMDRWMLAYCPCDNSLVPGLSDADVARLDVPVLVFRSGTSDMSHTRTTSEALGAGLRAPSWSSRRGEMMSGTSVEPWSSRLVRSSCAGPCSFRSSSTGLTVQSGPDMPERNRP